MVHTMHDKRCNEIYARQSAQMWAQTRLFVEFDQLSGLTQDDIEELCNRQWSAKGASRNGRLEIEPKAELKVRMNGKSPDRADCIVMICDAAAEDGYLPNPIGLRWGDWVDGLRAKRTLENPIFPMIGTENVIDERNSGGYDSDFDPEAVEI
jgi:hypothetical protein